jgi:hypothetical protein
MREPVHVVVVTALDEVRLGVSRLAALAGVTVEAVRDSAALRGHWHLAAAVVVGADLAPTVAAAGLPRRADVVLVTASGTDLALWRTAVEIGASRVVALPEDERALVELLTDVADASTTSEGGAAVVAVLGGCGGAGASTLAAATAVSGAASVPTALIDMDPLGGGVDVLLALSSNRVPVGRSSRLPGVGSARSPCATRWCAAGRCPCCRAGANQAAGRPTSPRARFWMPPFAGTGSSWSTCRVSCTLRRRSPRAPRSSL